MVTRTNRKPAPRTAKAAPALPFAVPAPVEKALKNAADRFDTLQTETRHVAAKVEKKVKTAAASIKKTSARIRRNPKGFVDGVVNDGRTLGMKVEKNVVKATNDATRNAMTFADQVSKRVSATVETVVGKTLHRFNVPTRHELRNLTSKVDVLSRKIDSLSATRARRAR